MPNYTDFVMSNESKVYSMSGECGETLDYLGEPVPHFDLEAHEKLKVGDPPLSVLCMPFCEMEDNPEAADKGTKICCLMLVPTGTAGKQVSGASQKALDCSYTDRETQIGFQRLGLLILLLRQPDVWQIWVDGRSSCDVIIR